MLGCKHQHQSNVRLNKETIHHYSTSDNRNRKNIQGDMQNYFTNNHGPDDKHMKVVKKDVVKRFQKWRLKLHLVGFWSCKTTTVTIFNEKIYGILLLSH